MPRPTADVGVGVHPVRIRPGLLWALGCVSAATLVLYALVRARQPLLDFEVYRMGGAHVFGRDLYTTHVEAAGGNLLFTYTPLAAMLFWPFSLVSTHAGALLWDLANIASLTALIAVSSAAARCRRLQRADWRLALMWLAPVGIVLWPVRYGLELGQIDLVLILMVVTDLTMGLAWRERRLPRGVLVGLAAAIKLTPLIFLPYLFLTRQWAAARNATLAFVVATGAMALVAPRATWSYFTHYAFDVQRVGSVSITNNQTLRAALMRSDLGVPHLLVDVLLALVLCAGLALAAAASRRVSAMLGILLCAGTGLLLSPISWEHHYAWCVPLLVWLAVGVDRPDYGPLWAGAAAIVFAVMPPGQSGDLNVVAYVRENAYVVATLGLMSLAGLLLWLRHRVPAEERTPNLPAVSAATGVRAQGAMR